MRALCEVDQKFLASLDPQLVTDVLLDTIARFFPVSVATVWLLDGSTGRLAAMACRNRTEPENQPVAVNGGLEFAMEVVEKRMPCMTTNAGAWSDEEGRKVFRNSAWFTPSASRCFRVMRLSAY